ncbi:MAG: hypothetical protein IJB82_03595 [Bacilli bacterium]|nr:hypothetical protein [Bacilli bacterium]
MNKIEKEKIVQSFLHPEIIKSLSTEALKELIDVYPETLRSASISEAIDRDNCFYFMPYEKEAQEHSMYDLPLSVSDYQKLYISANKSPEIFGDCTIYDLYLALLTEKNIPHLSQKTRDNVIIGLRIFRDLASSVKNDGDYRILVKNFIEKMSLIKTRWPEIRDYAISELKDGKKKIICSDIEPMVDSNGQLLLTDNDERTRITMAHYSKIDELIDKDYASSIGRMIVYK